MTKKSSLNDISNWVDQIYRIKDSDSVSIIILGNKCDLQEERQISTKEGQETEESKQTNWIKFNHCLFVCLFLKTELIAIIVTHLFKDLWISFFWNKVLNWESMLKKRFVK